MVNVIYVIFIFFLKLHHHFKVHDSFVNFQWMDYVSDQSDVPTSGVSSAFSTGESWDTVMNSINKK